MNLKQIQEHIQSLGADAWILVDYENKNPTLVKLLGQRMLTRKIFLVIPARGKPYLITHSIDTVYLNDKQTKANFDLRVYKTWKQMLELERESFKSYRKVFMDVSENGLLPRVSLADYGSVSFIASMGIEILSSADLMQYQTAVMSEKALQSQIEACKTSLKIKDEAFAFIKEKILSVGQTDEYEVQQFIAKRYLEEGMYFDEAPLVAIGINASNPHYTPTKEQYSPIKKGDLVLIDMWAKFKEPGSVYSDITWMGYVGREVPAVYAERFEIIKAARDGAIAFLKEQLSLRDVHAYEADDVAREIITKAGYGDYFVHRLGHSIYDDDSPHGPGANLDNFESHDTRLLLDGTSFSDEPGIYAPDFGMRTETDLHIKGKELLVVGGLQDKIIPILED